MAAAPVSYWGQQSGVDSSQLAAAGRPPTINAPSGDRLKLPCAIGLDEDVRMWFDHLAPKVRVNRRRIEAVLGQGGASR